MWPMRLIIPPAFVSVHLLCGRNRFGARGPGFTAERQLEFPGNLRPEFAQHIETHVLQDAVAHALRCWRETALAVPSHSEKLNMRRPSSRCATTACSIAWSNRLPPLPRARR